MKEKDSGGRKTQIITFICPQCRSYANIDVRGLVKWYDCDGIQFSPTVSQVIEL